jgi:hypothetical protein
MVKKGVDGAWLKQWRRVDRNRRRRIVRAVRRGEGVSDPRDATLALELIAWQRKVAGMGGGRFSRWLGRFHLLLGGGTVSTALITHDLRLVALVSLPVVYIGGLRVFNRHLQKRIAAAQEKNAQLVGRLS